MDWLVYEFHLDGNLTEVLNALVVELEALGERLRTGEGQIGRGTPRGVYAHLGINSPLVKWEHDKDHGDVVPFVHVSGYDVLTVPGEAERVQDLGELVVFSLADWGAQHIAGRVVFSRTIRESMDIITSVLWRLRDRWKLVSFMHSSSDIFDAFRRAYQEHFRKELAATTQATRPAPPSGGSAAVATPPAEAEDLVELSEAEALMLALWRDRYTAEEVAEWPGIPWSAGTVRNRLTQLRNRLGVERVPYHRK